MTDSPNNPSIATMTDSKEVNSIGTMAPDQNIEVELTKTQRANLIDSLMFNIKDDMVKTPKIGKKINLSESTLFEPEEALSIAKAGKAKMEILDEPQFDTVLESDEVKNYPADLLIPAPGPSRFGKFVNRVQKIGTATKKATQELLGYDSDSPISDHSSYGSTLETRIRRGDPN